MRAYKAACRMWLALTIAALTFVVVAVAGYIPVLLGSLVLASVLRMSAPVADTALKIALGALAVCSAAVAWMAYRAMRFDPIGPGEGRCRACGYDLTGNQSGVCPECGAKVET